MCDYSSICIAGARDWLIFFRELAPGAQCGGLELLPIMMYEFIVHCLCEALVRYSRMSFIKFTAGVSLVAVST